jgi:hypothetical protein
MRRRHVYLLIALLALLVLVVGVGSVLVSPVFQAGVKASEGALATQTPRNIAQVGGAEPSPTTALAPVVTITAVELPLAPLPSVPAPVAIATNTPEPPALPVQPPPTEVVQALPLTSQALTASTPATSRVGGPVDVPENHTGRRWVTLQAGHWNIQQLPIELQHLAGDTGAFGGGVSEADLNVQVVKRTAQLLADRGFNVEMLDATVPVSYTTDLFLAIHADGNIRSGMRGFKAVAPWVSVPASDKFVGIFYEEYGKATGLPSDPVTSVAMADYYAFNPITYNHAISANVPAALIEMGFVTNPLDRQVMTEKQDSVAWGIANSVDRFFRSGAVGDTPTPYPSFTPTITPTFTPTATPTATDTATATATQTATPYPTGYVPLSLPATSLPELATATLPKPTPTPIPTATPLQGIITADGRWLPPLAENGNNLPQPGSDAAPVLLNQAVDEPVMTADGHERQQVWQQFYMPNLGRSVWIKGPLLYVRH